MGFPVFSHLGFQDLGQLPQEQFGVGHDREHRRIFLVDVGRVHGGVDDGFSRRDRWCEGSHGKAGADGQDQVGVGQVMPRHVGDGVGADAGRKLMAFGEAALSLKRGHDGDSQEFGHCHQLPARLGVEDALAGPDHGTPGAQQAFGGLFHGSRIGGHPHPGDRRVFQVADELRVAGVVQQLQHHRARPPRAQGREGVPEPAGRQLGRDHLVGHLGGGPVVVDAVEGRMGPDLVQASVSRQEEDRSRIGEGVGHPRERVLGAGTGLDREDPDLPSVGGP